MELPPGMVLLPARPEAEALACLTPEERGRLAAFPSEKRRQDWLLGRVAAKEAVRRLLAEEGLEPPAWSSFALATGDAGEPRVGLPGGVAVSLSHGHGRAAAWARRSGAAGGLPGVDLELIRPRPEGTLRFYLHEEERRPVLALPGGEGGVTGPRDRLAIVLWALKEAAFKALAPPRGLGLLDVGLELDGPWDAPGGTCRVTFLAGLAERAHSLGGGEVRAAWQREGDLVLAWVEVLGARLP